MPGFFDRVKDAYRWAGDRMVGNYPEYQHERAFEDTLQRPATVSNRAIDVPDAASSIFHPRDPWDDPDLVPGLAQRSPAWTAGLKAREAKPISTPELFGMRSPEPPDRKKKLTKPRELSRRRR